ncbi:flagellar biosynthesis protein FlhB, partial [Brucella canis]
MADDADKESKTEEATEQKIRDALDKGNMPFSREAPILAGIASFLVIAVFVAAPAATRLAVFLRELIDRPEDWLLNSAE